MCVSRLVHPDPGSEGPDRGSEGPLVRRGQGRHHRGSVCGERDTEGFKLYYCPSLCYRISILRRAVVTLSVEKRRVINNNNNIEVKHPCFSDLVVQKQVGLR